MTCQEFKELVGALALGAADPEEHAACEAHLSEPTHDGCREALEAARETVAVLPLALPPVPPAAGVWDHIAARLTPAVTPIAPRRRRGAPVWVAAAGWLAAAAAVVLYLTATREGERRLDEERTGARERMTASAGLLDRCTRELEAVRAEETAQREALALAAMPGSRLVTFEPQGEAAAGQRGTVLVHPGAGRAVVMGLGLVAQPGKDYELWVLRGGKAVPAGLLRASAEGGTAVIVDPRLLEGGVDAFAISLEPAGGSEQPRGPILLVGKV